MRIVKRSELDEYLFKCPVCKNMLIATGDELTLKELGMGILKPFVFTCTCACCGEHVNIKGRKLTEVPVYKDI